MCGIAGYINISRTNFALDDALLYAMQHSLAHRGPDGFNIWKSPQHEIGLVHRRLSIIDLSDAATQPMITKDNRVTVSFNGEIYNHLQLRAQLEQLGYCYFSNSDTETLLYAYQEWGIDFIKRLEGMFAIALFDLRKNELYLIRDRIGVKPLYFSLQGGVLSFASEIKALWQLPWNQKKINKTGLYHYLTFLTTPAPITLFDQIYKLPAGFYAKIDSQRHVEFKNWYTPITQLSDADKAAFNDEQFCIDGVRTLLTKAVHKRMMSDVPFGVFLSGGIDSSLNVALMAQFTDKVKTFNVSFKDDPQQSEVYWARKVAKHFNTEHHEIEIGEREAFEFFNKMVYHQDEPLADCVCIPLYHVAKLLRDSGTVVVQVGEGSDELFCGYSSYVKYLEIYKKYWHPSQKFVPAFAKRGAYKLSSMVSSNLNHLDLIKNWSENKPFFISGAVAFSTLLKDQIVDFEHNELPDPIVQQIFPGLNLNGSSADIAQYYRNELLTIMPDADFMTQITYLELKQRLPELLLMRADKMTMATAVEARVPFLDHKLVEFALHIPTKFKYRNGQTKYILKKAAEGILPDEIIYRKKIGFSAPTQRWFKSGQYFKPFLQDMLLTKKDFWQEYLDLGQVQKLLNSKDDYAVQLWTLQNLMALDL